MSIPLRLAHTPSKSTETFLGTILYSGPVPPTSGLWYGVEWDDATRGKHDGVHEATGVRYFTCRTPGSGSFIRPSAPGLSLGTSFPLALKAKYSPRPTNEAGELHMNDKSTFYGTSSHFEIEVTSLAKIDSTFRNLGRLREAGLEWEGVSSAGEVEERRAVVAELSQLKVLNLSFSLISNLQIAAEIVEGMSNLRTLTLNSNRFRILDLPTFLPSFSRLIELQLNKTLVTWAEVLLLSPSLPSLVVLQLGTNNIADLATPISAPLDTFLNLETLNLAENLLSRWDEITSALASLPRLSRLILSSNAITSLVHTTSPTLNTLRHLSLSQNAITSWKDINALASIPKLDSLAAQGLGLEGEVRMGIIARLGQLVEIDGSMITPVEREDAELFYLSAIIKARSESSNEELEEIHPRWKELQITEYDQTPTSLPPPPPKLTIKSKLIQLMIQLPNQTLSHAVLPTLPTRVFRTQIAKKVGAPLSKSKWRMVAVLRPSEEGDEGPEVEVPESEEGREVGWWGLQEGDTVRMEER
ncbi:tubulin-specific chaperone E, partial [Phenoliferia sp. Uapishka_3]